MEYNAGNPLGATIEAGEIASNAVTTAKINDLAVTTAKIAANAVDGTKIAMGSDVAGDLIYNNGTDFVRLGIGTANQLLRTNSGATAPEWASLSGFNTLKKGSGTVAAAQAEAEVDTVTLTGLTRSNVIRFQVFGTQDGNVGTNTLIVRVAEGANNHNTSISQPGAADSEIYWNGYIFTSGQTNTRVRNLGWFNQDNGGFNAVSLDTTGTANWITGTITISLRAATAAGSAIGWAWCVEVL